MVDFVLFRLEHDLKADAATGKPKEEDEDALLPGEPCSATFFAFLLQ